MVSYNFTNANMNFFNNSSNITGLIQNGLGLICGNKSNNFNPLSGMGGFNLNSFSNYGHSIFTNCFGEENYDALAGYAVANCLIGCAGKAIDDAKSKKQAQKAEVKNNQQEIEKIDTQINELQDLYKADDETILKKIYPKPTSEKLKELQKKLTTYNSTAKSDTPPKQLSTETNEKYEIRKQEWQAQHDAYEQCQKAIEAEQEQVNKDAIEKYKKEISKQIDDLKEKKKKLLNSVRDNMLDDADGNSSQRIKEEKYKAMFGKDGTLDPNANVTKKAVRFCILKFRNAQTDDEKKNVAKQFKALWNANSFSENDKNDTTLKNAYTIISEYFPENLTEEE